MRSSRFSVLLLVLFTVGGASAASATTPATVQAPATLGAGAQVPIRWTGPAKAGDAVIIVPAGAPEKAAPPSGYQWQFAKTSPTTLVAPEPPGDYEVRYVSRGEGVLARTKLTLTPVSASVEAPASAPAGSRLAIKWTGPSNLRDTLAIVEADAPEKRHARNGRQEAFLGPGNTLGLLAPDEPGIYEIRYITGQTGSTLARAKLQLTANTATLEAPPLAVGGSRVPVRWTGPGNFDDAVIVVPAGAPEKTLPTNGRLSTFVKTGNPLEALMPEQAGDYELRYITGQSRVTLASAKITVGAMSASIEPATVAAGEVVPLRWKGPGNWYDAIVLVPRGTADDDNGRAPWVYLKASQTGTLRAPLQAGDYELRYITGQGHELLARAPLRVTPATRETGRVKVTLGQRGGTAGAVEIILDASGSMLQKLGNQRRIDIAKRALTELTEKTIPAGTPFALRVFGREAGSCQSDLELPVKPLDPAQVASRIAALEAKSNAKTPIAASLEKVAKDLEGVSGDRVVILITDGEETCGGQPAAAIEALKKGGVNVRVNIVGFAIDDRALKGVFERWSIAGNGAYFDARDAKGMRGALKRALQPRFEILDAKGAVVAEGEVGGEAVPVLPGSYEVRLKGSNGPTSPALVRAKDVTNLAL